MNNPTEGGSYKKSKDGKLTKTSGTVENPRGNRAYVDGVPANGKPLPPEKKPAAPAAPTPVKS